MTQVIGRTVKQISRLDGGKGKLDMSSCHRKGKTSLMEKGVESKCNNNKMMCTECLNSALRMVDGPTIC